MIGWLGLVYKTTIAQDHSQFTLQKRQKVIQLKKQKQNYETR